MYAFHGYSVFNRSGVLKDHTMMVGKVNVFREIKDKIATNFIFYLCHDLCVSKF